MKASITILLSVLLLTSSDLKADTYTFSSDYSNLHFTYCFDYTVPTAKRRKELAIMGAQLNHYIREKVKEGALSKEVVFDVQSCTCTDCKGYIYKSNDTYYVGGILRYTLSDFIAIVNYCASDNFSAFNYQSCELDYTKSDTGDEAKCKTQFNELLKEIDSFSKDSVFVSQYQKGKVVTHELLSGYIGYYDHSSNEFELYFNDKNLLHDRHYFIIAEMKDRLLVAGTDLIGSFFEGNLGTSISENSFNLDSRFEVHEEDAIILTYCGHGRKEPKEAVLYDYKKDKFTVEDTPSYSWKNVAK